MVREPINYSTKEVAAMLKISTGTLENWRCAGKGPPFKKYGAQVAYPIAAFHKWEEAQPLLTSTSAKRGAGHGQ